jgi:hypothetical protein
MAIHGLINMAQCFLSTSESLACVFEFHIALRGFPHRITEEPTPSTVCMIYGGNRETRATAHNHNPASESNGHVHANRSVTSASGPGGSRSSNMPHSCVCPHVESSVRMLSKTFPLGESSSSEPVQQPCTRFSQGVRQWTRLPGCILCLSFKQAPRVSQEEGDSS